MSSNEINTLLAVVNHVVQQHPGIAPMVEAIAKRAQGKQEEAGLLDWALRKFCPPSPPTVKRDCLLRNGFPNATWVETGTYLGETTEFLSRHAPFVYSIEPEPNLFSAACVRLKDRANVKIINGLSEVELPKLMPSLQGDCNFWLDGHYSQGVTYKGPTDTPIREELKQISQNRARFRNLGVLIDDVRCFDPELTEYSEYPSVDELVAWAQQNNLKWHIEHDIFVAKSV